MSAKNNSFLGESELSDICSFTFSRFFSFFDLLPLNPIHSLLQSCKTRCHGQLAVIPCFWIPFVFVILTHDNSRLRPFVAQLLLKINRACMLAFLDFLFAYVLFSLFLEEPWVLFHVFVDGSRHASRIGLPRGGSQWDTLV